LSLFQKRRESNPVPLAPAGDWYKEFGSFKLCGSGEYPKTFLLKGMKAYGREIE